MKTIKKIWHYLQYDTNGNIALAAFVIAAVSGVILAIPYDVINPFDSIALMLITNPGAVFFRNLHYWSAQFFLVFTLLHLWDHLKMGTSVQQPAGVWFRLVFSLLFTFLVMLSGFILKADTDSTQAQRILEALVTDIPFVGKLAKTFLFGNADSLQLIYVHHIATATLFLVYVIYEHVKTLFAKWPGFLISLSLLTLISFLLQAPFHNQVSPVIKGPWYFVGLQEILHWMRQPGWIWLVIAALLGFIYFTRYQSSGWQKISIKTLGALAIVYLLLTLIGFYFRGENWNWKYPWHHDKPQALLPVDFRLITWNTELSNVTASQVPIVRGKREACMVCHTGVSGFSKSHSPEAIGCSSCHLGNAFTLNKSEAHDQMVLVAGNLDFADQTCGTSDCHPGIPARVSQSLMSTNSGIVSVNRWVFNESDSPDAHTHIKNIGFSPADQHLRNLCAHCHLGNPKTITAPVDELTRGEGCTACHLNYSTEGKKQHFTYIENNKTSSHLPKTHPSLDIKITNDHCFGCHSRSGRIATNYEGWHETLRDEDSIKGKEGFRILQDKRVFEFVAEDIHHKAGMDCIDCHNSYETMGDGNIYKHEEQAVKIQCEDCHFNEKPKLARYSELDLESKKIFDLRQFKHQDLEIIVGEKSEIALVNTYIENDTAFLIVKNKGTTHVMNPPASLCTQVAHKNLTCSACHTAWAPQCIGCHNAFDKNAEGYDLLENRPLTGSWVEYVGKFLAEPPTLGVWENEEKQISPAIPGMVLTIEKTGQFEKDDKIIFRRLFAPAAPHTTSTKGRSCKSCHNNPLAIGYGRGELEYKTEREKGIWTFKATYAPNPYDGLPEDAWIAFPTANRLGLQPNTAKTNPTVGSATRTNFRPFTAEEQMRILRVGACLTCHAEDSEVMLQSLMVNFEVYLKEISRHCILPN